ncbi:hypothetical protein ACPUVO_16250 [Pseudocolwellia sp. HL-MZ19]|uniref:hypothetical protein n=1 Tax=Pseudocolwellia sp. HL-MZ19 TaxID=3400846 RepID=UPI003CEE744F
MIIHIDKCLELGLPEPKPYDNQLTYIKRLLLLGFSFNTHMARYCGIGNLHSLVNPLRKKGIEFIKEKSLVKCLFTGKTYPYPVIVLKMSPEQITYYKNTKTAKKD